MRSFGGGWGRVGGYRRIVDYAICAQRQDRQGYQTCGRCQLRPGMSFRPDWGKLEMLNLQIAPPEPCAAEKTTEVFCRRWGHGLIASANDPPIVGRQVT